MWRIALDLPEPLVADLVHILSSEEAARAKRLLSGAVRNRHIVAHAAKRTILGRYLQERPEAIRITTDARGKPHLVLPTGAPGLCFSLSHSEDVALCAVTEDRAVGVDIERVCPVSVWPQIVDSYFSADERQALRPLAGRQAPEAFFRAWTRKEAYSKALGEGISQRWTQFSVSLAPDAVAQVIDAGPDAQASGPFTLLSLAAGPGYSAAVAVQGAGGRLSCWQWA